ncbi:hypothetical protein E3Q14_04049 [Wallemia mellicola]|nr:hypothetical protein E3Q14_04049 [Wallemia mellicola]
MKLSTVSLLFTIALLKSAMAEGWAQFCDDDNCSVNCGTSVSTANDGCLEEGPNRKSVKFHGRDNPFFNRVSLVVTPHDKCSCQSQCVNSMVTGGDNDAAGCQKIPSGVSYRFIQQSCDPNNCAAKRDDANTLKEMETRALEAEEAKKRDLEAQEQEKRDSKAKEQKKRESEAQELASRGLERRTTYAQFCDDENCTENCGTSVSVDNPGCLVESGRGSIKFHDLNLGSIDLVATNNDQCSCQSHCYTHVVEGMGKQPPSCMSLKDNLKQFKSFRFLNTGGTGGDNGCSTTENTCDGATW